MGEFEAAAEIVTGAMAARAVEPRAGEDGHAAHGACLNCGTPLIGSHCHCCGQSGHIHRTVGAFFHDISHAVFHFEGKAWRTLPMLALRPGELTRRYIAGERARFVSPMALFLFSVFLMFAVVANLPGWHFGGDDWLKPGFTDGVVQAREKVVEQSRAADKAVVSLSRELAEERAEATPDADKIAKLQTRLDETIAARRGLKQAQAVLPTLTDGIDKATGTEAKATGGRDDAIDEAPGWLGEKIRFARDNPKLLFYKIKTSAYKFSWALIPISLPFIWLLFPLRRDVGLYDHAVFATYSLTFMSLLVIVLAVLGAIGVPSGMLWIAAGLIPPFHMYRQLKGAYRLSRGGALWRLFWLMNFTLITSMLFLLLLLYLGVAD